jgi:hypothetical protein
MACESVCFGFVVVLYSAQDTAVHNKIKNKMSKTDAIAIFAEGTFEDQVRSFDYIVP